MSKDRIEHEVLYLYPIWTVWRALTTSEALTQWLMPNDFVPQVGHRFTFRSEPRHGWHGEIACQVLELDAPYRLSFTWQSAKLPVTIVTFTLETIGQFTRLRLEHSGFVSGNSAISVRDLLDSGWGSKLRRESFLSLLDQLVVRS